MPGTDLRSLCVLYHLSFTATHGSISLIIPLVQMGVQGCRAPMNVGMQMGPEKAGGQNHVLGQALCWCFLCILMGESNASGSGAHVCVEDGGVAWTELPPIFSVNGDRPQSRA